MAVEALRGRPAVGFVISATGGTLALLARRRRTRIALLACLIVVPLLGGGWLWLRNSSLVAVQRVRVSGVHGPEARAIEAALRRAARRMSTLNLRPGALHAAVAPFRVVREIHAVPSFPHGLEIRVVERPPVAGLALAGTKTAVAADGVVLGAALLSPGLPTLEPRGGGVSGARVADPTLRGELAVLGAAPGRLGRLVARAFTGPKGLTLAMRNGLLAYFGDGSRPHAKWLSLARVLSDQSSRGASYVDVRVPERPAAGFPAGVTPPNASAIAGSSGAPDLPGNPQGAVAALEANLASQLEGASASEPGTGGGSAQAPAAEGAEAPQAPEAAGAAGAG